MRLPKIWYCIKFEHKDKPVWFRAKKGRNKYVLINYWRSKQGFKWGKVYKPFTKDLIFWFNSNQDGADDRRTSNKININKRN